MPSRDAQAFARLNPDTILNGILPGGIYQGSLLGLEGITSAKTTRRVYDAAGKLRACAIVRQRALIPTNQIRDLKEQVADANQVLEVWFYEWITSTAIEAGMDRTYALLEGYAFVGAGPCAWAFTLPVQRAPEFTGVNVARIDFQIMSLRRPIAA